VAQTDRLRDVSPGVRGVEVDAALGVQDRRRGVECDVSTAQRRSAPGAEQAETFAVGHPCHVELVDGAASGSFPEATLLIRGVGACLVDHDAGRHRLVDRPVRVQCLTEQVSRCVSGEVGLLVGAPNSCWPPTDDHPVPSLVEDLSDRGFKSRIVAAAVERDADEAGREVASRLRCK